MKERTLYLKADVGDSVKVADLESVCVILAICVSRYCTTYEIAYFHNGDRKTTYLNENEFELVPSSEVVKPAKVGGVNERPAGVRPSPPSPPPKPPL